MNNTDFNSTSGEEVLHVAEIYEPEPRKHQLSDAILTQEELARIDERAKEFRYFIFDNLWLDGTYRDGCFEFPSPTGRNPKVEKLIYSTETEEWHDQGEPDAHGIGMISLKAHLDSYTTMEAANAIQDIIDEHSHYPWISQPNTSLLPQAPINVQNDDLTALYGLEKLKDKALDEMVIFTTCEEAAEAICRISPFIGICTKLGSDISTVDFSPLVGRHIYHWPDNNAEGIQHMAEVSEALFKLDRNSGIFKLKPLMYLPELKYPIGECQGVEIPKGHSWDLKEREAALPDGFNAAHAFAEGWNIEYLCDIFYKGTQFIKFIFEEQRIENFLVKEDGVYEIKYKDGEEYETKISSSIEVTALTRDEQNKNWGMLLVFYDRDGVKHEWAMPKELLAGKDEYRQVLLSRGADIYPYGVTRLPDYLMAVNPKARALCVSSIGWHEGVFVLPEKCYGKNKERVILQSANAHKVSPYSCRGTLSEWQNNVGSKCVDNSRIIMATCVSMTGPFIQSLNIDNGGFHFRGASSTGKTKTLTVAGSTWGGKAMIRLWKATGNAIESLARKHNDTVLLLDELGQVDPREAGEIVYTLGNGQAKARANVNGDAKATANWRLMFISTGEISLADHIAAGGGRVRGGHEVRMIDIPSDAGAELGVFENLHGADSPAAFANSLQSLSESYYGTPADALLKKLTQAGELDNAIAFIKQKQAQFVRQYMPANSHGQIDRVAARFGAVAGVGEYCISIGIFSWEPGHATWGVLKCFTAWLESRGDNSASEDIRALAQVREFIERNGESRFTLIQDGIEDNRGQRTINRAGFRTVLNDGATEYWILPEMFKAEVCEGFDPTLVSRVLKDNGHLGLDSAGRSSVSKRLPGIGNKRVYVIKATLMQSVDD